MRRSRLTLALLLSLALHLVGLVLLSSRESPLRSAPSPAVHPEPLQIEVVESRPPPPREVVPPPAPQPVPAPQRPPRSAVPRPPRAEATPATPPPSAAAPTPPPAGASPDVPHAPRLLPTPGLLGGFPVGAAPSPSGRTVRPGDGPSREELLASEAERVQGRVQGLLDDGMARLQVENGLVDSYFGDMDDALEKGLSGAPLFAYEGVLKHFFKATPERGQALRELLASYQSYGASGNPALALGEPTGTDRLEDVARSGAAGARARTQPSAADVLEEYGRRSRALLVKLELVQSRTGQLLSVKLLEGSGNPLFDAYVLERVPPSLNALGPAPEHFSARAKASVRSLWAIEGHVSFARTIKILRPDALNAEDAAYISALVPLGLLSGRFEETRGEVIIPDFRRPHFDIRTELLRVYD